MAAAAADRYLDGRRWITARHAAGRTGFTRDHITRLCRTGKIEARQIDNTWYLDVNSLEQFLLMQDRRKEEVAAQLSELRTREYKAKSAIVSLNNDGIKPPPATVKIARVPAHKPRGVMPRHVSVVGVLVAIVLTTGSAFAFVAPQRFVALSQDIASFAERHAIAPLTALTRAFLPTSPAQQIAAAGDASSSTAASALRAQFATIATGTPVRIMSTIVARPNFASSTVFGVNVPLLLRSSLAVAGPAVFDNSARAGSLSVVGSANFQSTLQTGGQATFSGGLLALRGMTTQGAGGNISRGPPIPSHNPAGHT